MFAVEQEGVSPDILTVAKGITGGYLPLAATLTTEHVFESFLGTFESRRTFFHGHTYTGNPLACAAATASMRLFRERRIVEGLPRKAEALARALAPLEAHPHVGEIRRRGLMVGIELVRDRATKEEYAFELRAGHQVTLEARRRGAILRPLGNVVVLMPPLAMTEEELAELGRITRESIEAAVARL
jgi:adenosylmethionine-8-amino-7-oxononanoate aminotransferase